MKKKNIPTPNEIDFTDVFFKEVSEDVQNDNLKAFWKKYGIQIIAFTVICLTIAVSFETIKHWRDQQNQKWSNAFAYAQVLQRQGKLDDSITALEQLSKDGNAIYSDLAKMEIINILFIQNKSEQALKNLEDFVASAHNAKLKNVALIKLATYKAETMSADELSKLLQPIFDENNSSWQPEANELIAATLLREGKSAQAIDIYQQIVTSVNVNDTLRARAQNMLSVLTSSGDHK